MKQNKWLTGRIIRGRRLGTSLGYPTINIDNTPSMKGYKEGVYACLIKLSDVVYQGILFFGPRLTLRERNNIIEIFIFGFVGDIYGEKVEFQPVEFIRQPVLFKNTGTLRKQLEKDCKTAQNLLK